MVYSLISQERYDIDELPSKESPFVLVPRQTEHLGRNQHQWKAIYLTLESTK